jgi:hypothetical protein
MAIFRDGPGDAGPLPPSSVRIRISEYGDNQEIFQSKLGLASPA